MFERVSVRTSEKVLVYEVRQPESNTSKDEASLYDVRGRSDDEAVFKPSESVSEAEFAGDHYGSLCGHYDIYYGVYYELYETYDDCELIVLK